MDQGRVSVSGRRAAQTATESAPALMRALRGVFQWAGPLAPSAMGRIAYWLWFRPPSRRQTARELVIVDQATIGTMAVNGKSVITYQWGRGPAVLLVHGWNGWAGHMVAFVDPLVTAGYRAVAVDVPAHGRSSGRRTDVFEIASVLGRMERDMGPFAGVVAHSMGVLSVATAVNMGALRAPRFVCLSPAIYRDTILGGFARLLTLPDPVIANLAERVDRYPGPDFWRNAVIPMPTLVVHDRSDGFIPHADAERLVREWPDARLVTTDGMGHRGSLRDRKAIQRAVDFIATTFA